MGPTENRRLLQSLLLTYANHCTPIVLTRISGPCNRREIFLSLLPRLLAVPSLPAGPVRALPEPKCQRYRGPAVGDEVPTVYASSGPRIGGVTRHGSEVTLQLITRHISRASGQT